MKYFISILSGIFFIILLTFILTPVLNEMYFSINSLSAGPDGEDELLNFLIFVQWPLYFTFGILFGWFMYLKYKARNGKSQS